MKIQYRKAWDEPQLVIISRTSEINGGGPETKTFERLDGHHNYVSTHVHGGGNTVPSGVYNNARHS